MTKYYCNACEFEFTEEEAYVHEHNENVIMCPMCGAERWSDDDNSVIEKSEVEEEE